MVCYKCSLDLTGLISWKFAGQLGVSNIFCNKILLHFQEFLIAKPSDITQLPFFTYASALSILNFKDKFQICISFKTDNLFQIKLKVTDEEKWPTSHVFL